MRPREPRRRRAARRPGPPRGREGAGSRARGPNGSCQEAGRPLVSPESGRKSYRLPGRREWVLGIAARSGRGVFTRGTSERISRGGVYPLPSSASPLRGKGTHSGTRRRSSGAKAGRGEEGRDPPPPWVATRDADLTGAPGKVAPPSGPSGGAEQPKASTTPGPPRVQSRGRLTAAVTAAAARWCSAPRRLLQPARPPALQAARGALTAPPGCDHSHHLGSGHPRTLPPVGLAAAAPAPRRLAHLYLRLLLLLLQPPPPPERHFRSCRPVSSALHRGRGRKARPSRGRGGASEGKPRPQGRRPLKWGAGRSVRSGRCVSRPQRQIPPLAVPETEESPPWPRAWVPQS